MNIRKVFNTLVANVTCGYLSNVLLTVAMPSELGILVYIDFKSRETSMAYLRIPRSSVLFYEVVCAFHV